MAQVIVKDAVERVFPESDTDVPEWDHESGWSLNLLTARCASHNEDFNTLAGRGRPLCSSPKGITSTGHIPTPHVVIGLFLIPQIRKIRCYGPSVALRFLKLTVPEIVADKATLFRPW